MIPFMMEEGVAMSKPAKPTARGENEWRTFHVVGCAAARLYGVRAWMPTRRDQSLGRLSARPCADPGQLGGAPSFDSFWASFVSILILFEYHICYPLIDLWIKMWRPSELIAKKAGAPAVAHFCESHSHDECTSRARIFF